MADIYQVAVTLYRSVNGDAFFNDQLLTFADGPALRNGIITGKFPNRMAFLAHVPERLRRVIRKGMNPDPAKRFQSALDFSNALTRVNPTVNWSIEFQAGGAVKWEAHRAKQPNLLWFIRPVSDGFKAEFYTARNDGAGMRATKKQLWKVHPTQRDAEDYLSLLFAALAP